MNFTITVKQLEKAFDQYFSYVMAGNKVLIKDNKTGIDVEFVKIKKSDQLRHKITV